MKRLLIFLALASLPALAQTTKINPDCDIQFTFTGGGSSAVSGCGQNTQGVTFWHMIYQASGFSGLTITVQHAPDSAGSPGSWTTFTAATGSNPSTNTTGLGADSTYTGYAPWVRVTLSGLTGSGTVAGHLYGCRTPGCGGPGPSAGGGGGSPAGSTGCIQINLSGSFACPGAATVVASLPSASANAQAVYLISDGDDSADCVSGSGSFFVLCVSNGTNWLPIPNTGWYNGGSAITTSENVRITGSTTLAVGPNYAAGTGTAQAQTLALSPAVLSLTPGLTVNWLPTAANTGAGPTLAVNGLTAKTIVKAGGVSLSANDITTTAIATAKYDGTDWELQNPQTSAGGGSPAGSTGCIQINKSGSFTCPGAATVVGSLPSASGNAQAIYLVSDGTSTSDCTVGGGSDLVLCASSGSAWAALGGGGGGGSPAGNTGCVQLNKSGSFTCNGAATVIGSLPAAATNTAAVYLVSDGATSADCTTGSGSFLVLCTSTGAAWIPLSGGGVAPWFGGTVVPPIPGNWTGLGASCSTSTVTGVGGGNALQVISSAGSQNLCGLQTAVSAGNFSHIFIFYAAISDLPFASDLVGFTDGTKFEGCGVGIQSSASVGWMITTQVKSTALSGGSLSAANGLSTYTLPLPNPVGPNFFRLTRTGANLSCDWSPDGVNYFNQFNDTSPFLTASDLFVASDPRGSTGISNIVLASFQ